jgi:hypothetical protein
VKVVTAVSLIRIGRGISQTGSVYQLVGDCAEDRPGRGGKGP